mmetsp:Transcript_65414/g.147481  ORF Transcript_65414/g.147481 Transcript_65414/m.147481 type:complete len:214 (-) Transcript_65414:780-1421(-)
MVPDGHRHSQCRLDLELPIPEWYGLPEPDSCWQGAEDCPCPAHDTPPPAREADVAGHRADGQHPVRVVADRPGHSQADSGDRGCEPLHCMLVVCTGVAGERQQHMDCTAQRCLCGQGGRTCVARLPLRYFAALVVVAVHACVHGGGSVQLGGARFLDLRDHLRVGHLLVVCQQHHNVHDAPPQHQHGSHQAAGTGAEVHHRQQSAVGTQQPHL